MALKSTVVQTQLWVGYTDVDPTKICVKLSQKAESKSINTSFLSAFRYPISSSVIQLSEKGWTCVMTV